MDTLLGTEIVWKHTSYNTIGTSCRSTKVQVRQTLTEMTRRARRGLPLRVQSKTCRPVFPEASRRRGAFSATDALIRCSSGARPCSSSGKKIADVRPRRTPYKLSSSFRRWWVPLPVSSLFWHSVSSPSVTTTTPLRISVPSASAICEGVQRDRPYWLLVGTWGSEESREHLKLKPFHRGLGSPAIGSGSPAISAKFGLK